jgi:hypothetical protein
MVAVRESRLTKLWEDGPCDFEALGPSHPNHRHRLVTSLLPNTWLAAISRRMTSIFHAPPCTAIAFLDVALTDEPTLLRPPPHLDIPQSVTRSRYQKNSVAREKD